MHFQGNFITLLVENGTVYMTSLFGLSGTFKDGLVVGDPDSDGTASFVAGRGLTRSQDVSLLEATFDSPWLLHS